MRISSNLSCYAIPYVLGIILFAGCFVTEGATGKSLLLAEDGKSLLPIVVSPSASADVKATAAYLAEKLEKITGAKFEVLTGDGSAGIVLGTISQFPVEELKKSLETLPSYKGVEFHDGAEAYGIRTEAGRLFLLGGGDAGVSHAVSRFLEMLGYRRFYPAAEWEIVPSIPKLMFSGSETGRPFYLSRDFYGYSKVPALADWCRQQRLGESFTVRNEQQAYSKIVRENKAEFDAHPEYCGLYEGKRRPGSLCLSNPAVRGMAVRHALDHFAKNPGSDMCSIESPDGAGFCECDSCKALGDASSRVFGLANEVARSVRQNYPGKMIGVLAYYDHTVPPAFEMEPNVHVQICRIFIQSDYSFRELIEMWSAKTWNLGDYDYLSLYSFGQDRLRPKANAMPTANLELLRLDFDMMARKRFRSFYSECGQNWGAHGRGNLVATALLWNPKADVDAILSDFYEKAFGPAAPAMRRYFERVDGQNAPISRTMLALAFRDVDEAARMAKDLPDVQRRLDHVKQFLYYNYLHQRLRLARDDQERKDLTLRRLTHEFRIRDAYITSWGMVKGQTLPAEAKKYSEPTWVAPQWKAIYDWRVALKDKKGDVSVTPPHIPPWMAPASTVPDPSLPGYDYVRPEDVYPPYRHEETERLFQEGLAYFQPQKLLDPVSYSEDLVPVRFPGAKPAAGIQVQHPGYAYLYSLTGEPVQIELRAADKILDYSLCDKSGNIVAKGVLQKENSKIKELGFHALKLNVPGAGLYRLECRGPLVSKSLQSSPSAFSLESPGNRYAMNPDYVFFYVPKGTRQIQFLWEGDDHELRTPSGATVKVAGQKLADHVTISVPDGEDGKVWSFRGRWDTRRFVNIPNYIGPSSDVLLVPRELAEKDNLEIITKK